VSDAKTVRGLQERAARALPAEHVEVVGGWWLRHAPSCSWWVGTVLPHGEVPADELAGRVVEAERFYAGHGTAACFQISPGACPDALDALLADRGYRRERPISLRAAATSAVLARAGASEGAVRLDERPSRAWFGVWEAVHGGDLTAEWDLLGRVDRASVYAGAMSGDDVVAVGRAVADTGWVGVFGMATRVGARGTGAGRAVLGALAGWAAAGRAERMYLQVECDNIPALRLYERMGFGEVCRYHYRTAS
jgi:N-acetylglutamate synthase